MKARRLGAFRRALNQMAQNLWLQLGSVSTLTVALALMGGYLALSLNVNTALDRLATGGLLLVVLKDDVSETRGRKLLLSLAEITEVREVRYLSREEALNRFREQLGQQQNLLDDLDDNPLPNSIELFLMPGQEPLDRLPALINAYPEVSEVLISRPWLHRLASLGQTIRQTSLVLGVLFFMGVVLLVANTVRLAVYARRDYLQVLDLVGATPGYVRGPFIWEAVLQALIAAGLALGLVWLLLLLLHQTGQLPLGLDLADFLTMPWQMPVLLISLALISGILGGLLGVGRILRGPEIK